MFNFVRKGVMRLNNLLNREVGITADNLNILELEVQDFKMSHHRLAMIKACEYYDDRQKIQTRKRTAIGCNGNLVTLDNVPNAHILDNQFAIHVDKKVNYLLGKPFTVNTDNDNYTKLLEKQLDKKFRKKLKLIGTDMVRCGVGYLFPYYRNNELKFKRFKPYEIKVYYKDDEKEEIDFFFRHFVDKVYKGTSKDYVEKVEVFTKEGIKHYIFQSGRLYPDTTKEDDFYITTDDGQAYNWDRIPLIVFKYNEEQQILFERIKELQDSINVILSNFQNCMEEDTRNTILIIENYDGENLGEFRQNLATYGAVKVRSSEGGKGDVRSLYIDVNADNYKVILEELRKALIKGMKSVDVDELKSGTPNQMNIQSMFTDIDQDANSMETEIQDSMDDLLWFVDMDLSLKGKGDFREEEVRLEFNRDLMSDETSIIDNVVKLVGLVSDETLLAQIPFIDDPAKEAERYKKQQQEEMAVSDMNSYGGLGNEPTGSTEENKPPQQ